MDAATPSAALHPRSVDAGRGLAWWTDAWPLFTTKAGMWILLGLMMILIFGLLGVIPFLGGIAAALLAPVFTGGWMIAVRKVQAGGELEVGDAFAGFQGPKLTPLLVLGALLLAAALLIAVVVGMLGFGAAFGMAAGGASGSAAGATAAFGAGMIALLLMTLLGFVVAMAIWYAPALVVFRGVAPFDAMKASFAASLKNVLAFVVYGVIYLVAAVIASIPFALGWLVLVPMLMISMYLSYEDIFGNGALAAG